MAESPAKQDRRDSKTGRFVKGVSGNPNGRPHKITLKEAIRNHKDSDIETLARLAWKKALEGDLPWAQYVMSAYPIEQKTELSGGLTVPDTVVVDTPRPKLRAVK